MVLLSDSQVTLTLGPPSMQKSPEQLSSGMVSPDKAYDLASSSAGYSGHGSASPLQDELHLVTDHSELSSGNGQMNNADLQPHHKSHSSTSRRIRQVTSRARSDTEPMRDTSGGKSRCMIHLPSSSRSAPAPRPLSIQSDSKTYSKSPTSHDSFTKTTVSPSSQLPRQASSSGFKIKLPSPQNQASTREPPAPGSTHTTPPSSVAPSNTGKGYGSDPLEGSKTGGGSKTHGTARYSGSAPVSQSSSVATGSSTASLPPVTENGPATITSLVDVVGQAFAKNALYTPSYDIHPERRRPLAFASPALTKSTSNTSSIQPRPRNEDRESYIQRRKLPQGYNERGRGRGRGRGRILDEDDFEDLLSANVTNVAFDTEARTKVNDHVRRSNLRHLLHATAIQDAAHPGQTGIGGENDEDESEEDPIHVRPRFAKFAPSRSDLFFEMLERTFGPDTHWGGGPKPKAVLSDSDSSQVPSPAEQDGYESDGEATEEATTGVQVYGQGAGKRRALGDVAGNDPKRVRISESESSSPPELATLVIDRALADSWVALLQGLVKGKTKMNREQMALLSDELNKIDQMKAQVSFEIAMDSMLWRTMTQLSELEPEDVPFGDEHGLPERARRVASSWRLKWSSEMQPE